MTIIRFMDKTPGYQKPECLDEHFTDDENVVIVDIARGVVSWYGDPMPIPKGTTSIEIVMEDA